MRFFLVLVAISSFFSCSSKKQDKTPSNIVKMEFEEVVNQNKRNIDNIINAKEQEKREELEKVRQSRIAEEERRIEEERLKGEQTVYIYYNGHFNSNKGNSIEDILDMDWTVLCTKIFSVKRKNIFRFDEVTTDDLRSRYSNLKRNQFDSYQEAYNFKKKSCEGVMHTSLFNKW